MQTLLQDLRYGVRMLLKQKGFTLIAIFTLALGIGANTAIFSVMNAVLLRTLPYTQAERLVTLWEKSPDNEQSLIDAGNFSDWQAQNQVFAEMAVFGDMRLPLEGEGEPQEVVVQRASANLFSVLGVNAWLGRTFASDESNVRNNRVVVLSYECWQRRFGSDPQVIGRQVNLMGFPLTIIGVMPQGFTWHIRKNSVPGQAAEFWWPYRMDERWQARRGRFLSGVARLKPNVSHEQAQAEMNVIAARLERAYPESNRGYGVSVVPLRQQLAGEIRPALFMLMGAVGFVLLIACATVANLSLARAALRQKEIAVRAALGAGRIRIVRQLLTESALLAGLGGVAGLLLASWCIKWLLRISPPELGDAQNIRLDLPVLGFTFVIALLTGLAFGLAPAYSASRLDLTEALKETGQGVSAGRSQSFRHAFVIAEMALALVLLVGAGLLLKSFWRLQNVGMGINAKNVLTLRVESPPRTIGQGNQQDAMLIGMFDEIAESLRALPGVESVGAISDLPFAGLHVPQAFHIESRLATSATERDETRLYGTDHDYFQAMQIPLRHGRFFTRQETVVSQHVALINEAFAKKYFPNEDPTRHRVTFQKEAPFVFAQIIGVVGDVKQQPFDPEVKPAVYLPVADLPYRRPHFVLRTRGEALALAPAAQAAIKARFPKLTVGNVQPLEGLLARLLAQQRFTAWLLAAFAGTALLLAALGIYGVMAYVVTQRTQEIGIRTALGAQRRDVLWLVMQQGMRLAATGILIGLSGAWMLTRLLKALLYGVTPTDPIIFAATAGLLLLTALLACWIPARRATKVDPLIALRQS